MLIKTCSVHFLLQVLVDDTWTAHTAKVLCLAWSPDSQHIASGALDTHIKIWTVGENSKHITIERKLVPRGMKNTIILPCSLCQRLCSLEKLSHAPPTTKAGYTVYVILAIELNSYIALCRRNLVSRRSRYCCALSSLCYEPVEYADHVMISC